MFHFQKMTIPDVILITPKVFGDERGFFFETYKKSEFLAAGIDVDFVQDNYSHSTKSVLRGLHFQNQPCAMGKLVGVRRGKTFDVAVDIRRGSPWYGRWVGVELSDENRNLLWVPNGFAHGFLTLSDEADVFYKGTAEYAPHAEAGIRFDDPTVAVAWPECGPVVLSQKDANQPLLADADNSFEYVVKQWTCTRLGKTASLGR